jgi:hypothetical protein
VSIDLNGVSILETAKILANDSIVWDIKQVMGELEVISASASATTVNFHFSGVEIS